MSNKPGPKPKQNAEQQVKPDPVDRLTERERDILYRHMKKAEKCLSLKQPIPEYVKATIEHYGEKVPK